jgi:lysozyme family protein
MMSTMIRILLAILLSTTTSALADVSPAPTDASSTQPRPSGTSMSASAAPTQSDDSQRLASAHHWKLAGGVVTGVGITAAAASIALAIVYTQCAPDSDCRSATGAYSVIAGIAAVITLPVGIGLYFHGRSLARSPATVSWLAAPHGGGLVLRTEF